MVAGLVLHGFVLVAEDEEVDGWVELRLLLGVLVEAGVGDVVIIAAFHLVFEFLQAVLVRPFQGQSDAQVGMQPLEQPLAQLAFKHLLQELVAFVTRTSAIAVDKEKLFAFDGLNNGLTMHLKPKFIVEVAETP